VTSFQLAWRVFAGAVLAKIALGYGFRLTGASIFLALARDADPIGQQVAYKLVDLVFRREEFGPSDTELLVFNALFIAVFGLQVVVVTLLGRVLWRATRRHYRGHRETSIDGN
jgi:uncharacterized iron-regulated membrane protein